MSRFTDAGKVYVPTMTRDGYFPPPLVGKLRAHLEELVAYLEEAPRTVDEVQAQTDVLSDRINALQEEFWEAKSEIETAARDDIAETVSSILAFYEIDLDAEEALRNRDW